jgi:hypothetical protein
LMRTDDQHTAQSCFGLEHPDLGRGVGVVGHDGNQTILSRPSSSWHSHFCRGSGRRQRGFAGGRIKSGDFNYRTLAAFIGRPHFDASVGLGASVIRSFKLRPRPCKAPTHNDVEPTPPRVGDELQSNWRRDWPFVAAAAS